MTCKRHIWEARTIESNFDTNIWHINQCTVCGLIKEDTKKKKDPQKFIKIMRNLKRNFHD